MDKIRKFFAMESDEIDLESNDSVEFRSYPGESVVYEEETMKSTVMPNLPKTTQVKQEIVVFQPGSFNEAQSVAEHIKARKAVIINMKKTDKDLAKRIIDFLSGINYAVDGKVQKIADNIFLFAPSHIKVTMVDEMEVSDSESPLFNRRT